MSPLGETGRPAEDEWWRQLYGEPPRDPDDAEADAVDSLDEHFATAVTATGGPDPATPPPPDPPPAPPAEPPAAPPPVPRPADTLWLKRPSTPEPIPALPPGWAPVRSSEPVPPARPARPVRPAPYLPPAAPAPEPARPVPPPVPPVPPASRPPAPVAEPAAWPAADPDRLEELTPDTVLDGARYGRSTLRAAAVRGDAARYRGLPRSATVLTARFGTGADALLFAALASGPPATEAARLVGAAVGRSRLRLADDLRSADHGALKSGLQRLTDRVYSTLGTRTGDPQADAAVALRCLLLPVDPGHRTRVFFGVGPGGLLRLRDGGWHDLDPDHHEPGFRFQACTARPGDVLLLCGTGLAEPLRAVPELAARLAERWSPPRTPPTLPAFLADATTRAPGHTDDRGAVAVWEDPAPPG